MSTTNTNPPFGTTTELRSSARDDTPGPDRDTSNRPLPPPAAHLALFTFLHHPHLPLLALALFLSLVTGLLPLLQALLFGRLFDAFALFGSGAIPPATFSLRVSRACGLLAALGAGTWAGNALFFAAWVAVGEVGARAARREVFAGAVRREVVWFEGVGGGVGGMLARMQMYAHTYPFP